MHVVERRSSGVYVRGMRLPQHRERLNHLQMHASDRFLRYAHGEIQGQVRQWQLGPVRPTEVVETSLEESRVHIRFLLPYVLGNRYVPVPVGRHPTLCEPD